MAVWGGGLDLWLDGDWIYGWMGIGSMAGWGLDPWIGVLSEVEVKSLNSLHLLPSPPALKGRFNTIWLPWISRQGS